jgi:hypothetical protein
LQRDCLGGRRTERLLRTFSGWRNEAVNIGPEVLVVLVPALVFKTSVGLNKVPGGFDSHPPPPIRLGETKLSLATRSSPCPLRPGPWLCTTGFSPPPFSRIRLRPLRAFRRVERTKKRAPQSGDDCRSPWNFDIPVGSGGFSAPASIRAGVEIGRAFKEQFHCAQNSNSKSGHKKALVPPVVKGNFWLNSCFRKAW